MATFNVTKRAFVREKLSVTNGGVTTLTAATYNDTAGGLPTPSGTTNRNPVQRKATGARIVLDSGSGDIHFTEEGSTPTVGVDGTGVGSIAGARDVIILDSYESIVRFKMIALTGTAAQAEIVYFR